MWDSSFVSGRPCLNPKNSLNPSAIRWSQVRVSRDSRPATSGCLARVSMAVAPASASLLKAEPSPEFSRRLAYESSTRARFLSPMARSADLARPGSKFWTWCQSSWMAVSPGGRWTGDG
jgi:hypothetical protein